MNIEREKRTRILMRIRETANNPYLHSALTYAMPVYIWTCTIKVNVHDTRSIVHNELWLQRHTMTKLLAEVECEEGKRKASNGKGSVRNKFGAGGRE